MTFGEATDWLGRRGGSYAMIPADGAIVIRVTVGRSKASVTAASTSPSELQAALIRAIALLPEADAWTSRGVEG